MTDNAVHVSPVATTKAPAAAPHTPAEAGFGSRHKRSYLLAIGIGVVMAIIAPLQTNFIPLLPRMVYWQILMVSGATLGLGVTELVERWGRLRKWPWAEVPLIGILIALPLTMIVMGAGAMFFGTQSSGVFRFGYNFAITALISVAITALGHMINGDKPHLAQAPATATTAEPIPTNRFAERLPLPPAQLIGGRATSRGPLSARPFGRRPIDPHPDAVVRCDCRTARRDRQTDPPQLVGRQRRSACGFQIRWPCDAHVGSCDRSASQPVFL